MLHNLLDNTTARRMKLLETMIFYDHWVSSSSLAKICRTSARTINNDLQFLKMNYPEYFTIETSKQHGVRLKPTTYFRLEVFYRHLMNENSVFQLIEGLFFHPEYSTQDWQDTLFLSSSSFYRLMKRIETALDEFDIRFYHGGFLGSSEISLRYFFSNFFTEKYSYFNWPFKFERQPIIEGIQDFINYIQKEYFNGTSYYTLDSKQMLHISMLIGTALVRIKQGFVTYIDETEDTAFNWRGIADKFYESHKNVAQQYMGILTREEYYDLVYTLFAFVTSWDSKEEYEHVNGEIEQFIQNYSNRLEIPISESESRRLRYIMSNKYASYKIFPYDSQILFNQPRFVGQLIHEIYPDLFESLVSDLEQLSEDTHYPWLKDLSEIIFWFIVKWPNLPRLLRTRHEKIKTLIISDVGHEHQEYVIDSIENVYSEFMDIDSYENNIFELEDHLDELDEKYDLIIFSFDHEEHAFFHATPLNVNPILSDIDFKNIAGCLQEIRHNHHLGVAELHRIRLQ